MNIDKGLKHLKQADEKMGHLIAEFEKPEFKKDLNYFRSVGSRYCIPTVKWKSSCNDL